MTVHREWGFDRREGVGRCSARGFRTASASGKRLEQNGVV